MLSQVRYGELYSFLEVVFGKGYTFEVQGRFARLIWLFHAQHLSFFSSSIWGSSQVLLGAVKVIKETLRGVLALAGDFFASSCCSEFSVAISSKSLVRPREVIIDFFVGTKSIEGDVKDFTSPAA